MPRPRSSPGGPFRTLRPVALLAFLGGLLALGMLLIAFDLGRSRPKRRESVHLTRTLGLTDLVLVTDARYLRHLSLADRHSAFQDHPVSLEHFPSGALIAPPAHLHSARAPGPVPGHHAHLD